MDIKYLDLDTASCGRMKGQIEVWAYYWETRYSWGHTAEVRNGYHIYSRVKYRYYNRTWERYRFESVIHGALAGYVHSITGISPFKELSKRDQSPMKSAAAEERRLARVAAVEYSRGLYKNLCALADGDGVIQPLGQTAAA